MKYQAGQTVIGKITGIQPYGAFVSLDDSTTGLIHISEISDDFVKDVHYFVKVGELVNLKIIDIDQSTGQVRLSLKAQYPNSARKDKKVLRKNKLPSMRIGFRSLEAHLEQWVAEKKGENNHD